MVTALEKKLTGRESQGDSIWCARCQGLMIVEEPFDSIVGAVSADFLVRRCVQCGEVIDPIILQNRRSQQEYDPGRTIG
jgi:hypothetical protein